MVESYFFKLPTDIMSLVGIAYSLPKEDIMKPFITNIVIYKAYQGKHPRNAFLCLPHSTFKKNSYLCPCLAEKHP